ncbi:MAG: MBL fold metallo-hydrolase [Eubacterium sp.]|nr:MBL fold metallo-hydrolase [Eubacterium sp.]
MKTSVTIIVDNTSDRGIPGEWGLSVLIDYSDKKILLDAGSSDLFLENMSKLGIDVKDIDYAVLSHAHYDHANGMPAFLDNNTKARLFMREGTAADCYRDKEGGRKYIGIPQTLLGEYIDRIEIVSADYKLMDGVYLIPHKTPGLVELGKRERMFRQMNNGWIIDDFSHEQSLVFDTDRGLVILNSCSHGGAANIINEIRETFPDKKVYGMIGGFHLYNKTDEEIRAFAEKVRETGIEYICTGHCTEERAFSILKEELGSIVDQMRVGMRVEF